MWLSDVETPVFSVRNVTIRADAIVGNSVNYVTVDRSVDVHDDDGRRR